MPVRDEVACLRASLERIVKLAGEFEGPQDPADALLACEQEAIKSLQDHYKQLEQLGLVARCD